MEPDGWRVDPAVRLDLDADARAEVILARLRAAAARIDAPPSAVWGVAVPDPFDYARGVGRFEGVGKFAALRGVDVRAGLGVDAVFLNDADAFALGEWTAGVAVGVARCAGVTLGTGVGSGWLVDGAIVDPGDPPGGRLHRVQIDGRPLEDVVSRRAIRAAYGNPALDVREIAGLARAGETAARAVLDAAFGALGRALAPRLAAFRADRLVLGGSMARSWDLFEPSFRAGAGALPPIRVADDSGTAPLIGAAAYAGRDA